MYNGIKVFLIIFLIFAITYAKVEKSCEYIFEKNYCKRKSKDSVCGYNSVHYKKFPNKCEFEYENCVVKSIGEEIYHHVDSQFCKKHKHCDVLCVIYYHPHCATNGTHTKTFRNLCYFEVAQCMEGWTYVAPDRCEDIKFQSCKRM